MAQTGEAVRAPPAGIDAIEEAIGRLDRDGPAGPYARHRGHRRSDRRGTRDPRDSREDDRALRHAAARTGVVPVPFTIAGRWCAAATWTPPPPGRVRPDSVRFVARRQFAYVAAITGHHASVLLARVPVRRYRSSAESPAVRDGRRDGRDPDRRDRRTSTSSRSSSSPHRLRSSARRFRREARSGGGAPRPSALKGADVLNSPSSPLVIVGCVLKPSASTRRPCGW